MSILKEGQNKKIKIQEMTLIILSRYLIAPVTVFFFYPASLAWLEIDHIFGFYS